MQQGLTTDKTLKTFYIDTETLGGAVSILLRVKTDPRYRQCARTAL